MGEREEKVTLMHMAKAFTEEIVQVYLDTASRKLYEKWEHSQTVDERERAYLEALALKEFRGFIRRTIIAGEDAQRELNDKEERERQEMLSREKKKK